MASNNTTELYPGESPPFTVITPTDQSGVILIGTALALIFGFISLLIRLYVRLQLRHDFGRDDIAALLAMIVAIAQGSLVFAQESVGFGRTGADDTPEGIDLWQKELYASDLLYLITLWLTRCSVAFLFLRLSPDARHNLATYTSLVACTVLTVVAIFLLAIRCHVSQPWLITDDQCADFFVRWQVITAFDVVAEASLFAVACYIVHTLQLSLGKKLVVVLAFGLRLPVIAVSLLRLHYLGIEFASPDPTLDGVLASICTQILLSYAIIAMTTPCLKPFMAALNTGYGGPTDTTPKGSRVTKTGRSDNDFTLGSLSNRPGPRRTNYSQMADTRNDPETRWDRADYQVAVMSGDQRSTQSDDSKRMIISKNTEWTVEYGKEAAAEQPAQRTSGQLVIQKPSTARESI